MLCNSNPVRIKRRPKGILLKIEVYSRKPVYEDKDFVWYGASNGQGSLQKYMRKSCVYCGSAVSMMVLYRVRPLK